MRRMGCLLVELEDLVWGVSSIHWWHCSGKHEKDLMELAGMSNGRGPIDPPTVLFQGHHYAPFLFGKSTCCFNTELTQNCSCLII